MSDSSPEQSGRRPLKSRQWRVFQKLAGALANSGVTPNAISVSSVAFAVAAGACLALTTWIEEPLVRRIVWLLSGVMIQFRLIANLMDGMVAIEGGKKSAVGDLYNEVPDRLSDPAILIGAGFAWGSCPMLGLTAALVAVFVAYVRAIGASVGVGQVFLGPFAKQQRMAVMTLVCIASAIFPMSWQPIHAATGSGICGGALLVIIGGGIVTAVRRMNHIARLMRERQEVRQ